MKKTHKLGLLLLLVAGCHDAVAPIKTVDDVAHEACGYYFAQTRKISFQDAANAFCFTEDQLRPFVQGLRSAGRRAESRAKAMVR